LHAGLASGRLESEIYADPTSLQSHEFQGYGLYAASNLTFPPVVEYGITNFNYEGAQQAFPGTAALPRGQHGFVNQQYLPPTTLHGHVIGRNDSGVAGGKEAAVGSVTVGSTSRSRRRAVLVALVVVLLLAGFAAVLVGLMALLLLQAVFGFK
jgi:hypothetical protein